MLERVMPKRNWEWMACGKHPAASDYFKVGSTARIFDAFSSWMEAGCQNIAGDRSSYVYSWRFWAKGPEKEALICGVVRDSSDSLGRPYPLLVMGAGPVKGLKQHWEFLPGLCDGAWRQMEHLSTKRFEDVRQMEAELERISLPEAFEIKRDGEDLGGDGFTEDIAGLVNSGAAVVPLGGRSFDDPQKEVASFHLQLKLRLKELPSAVFMGGIPERSWMTVFNRPLSPSDFIRLWSCC